MASKKQTPFDAREWWVCEGCGTTTEGKDPPDVCVHCGHRYHANLADELGPSLGDKRTVFA